MTSVKVDASHAFGAETIVSTSDYVVHSDRGVIQSVMGPFLPRARNGLINTEVRIWTRGPRVVQVVYATATSAVPNDVKEAYARLVGHWYRKLKTDVASNFQNVAQQKYGDTFVIFGGDSVGAGMPRRCDRLTRPLSRASRVRSFSPLPAAGRGVGGEGFVASRRTGQTPPPNPLPEAGRGSQNRRATAL